MHLFMPSAGQQGCSQGNQQHIFIIKGGSVGVGGTEELRNLKTLHYKTGHDSVGQLGIDMGIATLCLQPGVAWKEA